MEISLLAMDKNIYFLSYNCDNVLKHLLAIEDHLRNLDENYEAPDASCIVKHLLQLEEQCDEGISHASALGEEEKVKIFKEVRREARRLRRSLERRERPMELIRKVRAVRKRAEKLNPLYDLEKCETCGSVEEALEELENIIREARGGPQAKGHPGFDPKEYLVLEREMAERFIRELSEKYGVDPPKLVISDKCHEPDQALYDPNSKIIMVCKSGVNYHVIAHEWYHHYQWEKGFKLSEDEAERFAIDLFKNQKTLYYKSNHNGIDGKMVRTLSEVAVLYGGMHIGEGLERALIYADTVKPEGIFGVKISLLGDIIGTIGGIWGAVNLRAPYDLLAALIGGHLSTDLWRHAEEMMAPTLRLRAVPAPTPTFTPAPTSAPIAKKQVTARGRYTVTA